MNCLYNLDNVYAFNGNTTAFIEMEDGINEYGLAVGLTFIYPTVIKPGFNAGMLVRYLLEKCKTTNEALAVLKSIPVASQQTLTIADREGNIVVVECNCEEMEIIRSSNDEGFVVAANEFVSDKMKPYNNYEVDSWKAEERYSVVYNTLKEHKGSFTFDLIRDILAGKYQSLVLEKSHFYAQFPIILRFMIQSIIMTIPSPVKIVFLVVPQQIG